MASRSIEVTLVGDASSLERAFGKAGKSAFSFGNVLKAGLGIDLVHRGIDALTGAVKLGFGEFQDSQKVAAQTAAVLKSTGGAANVSADHVSDLAGSLLKLSGVDDEAIQSGENMLLTFKNIRNEAGRGNDIFDQTTKAVLDMDEAMTHGASTQESLSHTSILVGKALNDPIAGLSALHRVGVSFTEAQKNQIKAMVEAGNTMGAQKIILAELTGEFGGSAQAVGQTFAGQMSRAKEEATNFAGELVAKAIPVLQQMVSYIEQHWPQIQATIVPIMQQIGAIIAQVITDAEAFWQRFGGTIMTVLRNVKTVIQDSLKVIRDLFAVFGDLLSGDWSKLWQDLKRLVVDVLHLIVDAIHGAGQNMLAAMRALGGLALEGLRAGLEGLAGLIRSAVMAGISAVADLGKAALGAASSVAENLVHGIVSGLSGLGSSMLNAVKGALEGVLGAIESFSIHVHLPSINTHLPGVGKIGGQDFDIHPFAVALAEGGVVTSATTALLGEAGPEAVIPLNKAGIGLGGVNVRIERVYSLSRDHVTARELAKAIKPHLDQIVSVTQ